MRSDPNLQYLLLAPGTLLIVVGLLWLLQEEIADTMIGTRYAFTFKATSPTSRSSKITSRRTQPSQAQPRRTRPTETTPSKVPTGKANA
jgi:hypothetical protein